MVAMNSGNREGIFYPARQAKIEGLVLHQRQRRGSLQAHPDPPSRDRNIFHSHVQQLWEPPMGMGRVTHQGQPMLTVTDLPSIMCLVYKQDQ